MGNNPSKFDECGDNCPVEQVSWNDIQDFINKLNNKTGKTTAFLQKQNGNMLQGAAARTKSIQEVTMLTVLHGITKNSGNKTHPVGQKKPNGLGLYDMSGNV